MTTRSFLPKLQFCALHPSHTFNNHFGRFTAVIFRCLCATVWIAIKRLASWLQVVWFNTRVSHISFYLSRLSITKLQMFSVTKDHLMLCGEHFWTHLSSHLSLRSCKVQIPLVILVRGRSRPSKPLKFGTHKNRGTKNWLIASCSFHHCLMLIGTLGPPTSNWNYVLVRPPSLILT